MVRQLAQKLAHVKDFRVTTMYELPTEVRSSLVDFAADVVEQHKSKMTDMHFLELIHRKEVSVSD